MVLNRVAIAMITAVGATATRLLRPRAAGGSIDAVRLYGEPTHLAKGHR